MRFQILILLMPFMLGALGCETKETSPWLVQDAPDTASDSPDRRPDLVSGDESTGRSEEEGDVDAEGDSSEAGDADDGERDRADVEGEDGVDGEDLDGDTEQSPWESGLADGPAAELFIDGSVHTGTTWSGETYEGVWGEPFHFRMSDYPLSWAISTVHASMLLRSQGLDFSPNGVLTIAIKESKLGCANSDFPGGDGCFQIESTTAYEEMRRMFPERFTHGEHADVVGGGHFESAAITSAYYSIFSVAMFRMHSDDPVDFFARHPDPRAGQKTLCAAYNRGLWWEGLREIFSSCADRDVVECFKGNQVAIDHANAIADYTEGMDKAEPFDRPVRFSDLEEYWARIKPIYADVDDETALSAMSRAFEGIASEDGTISFRRGIVTVLKELAGVLPEMATVEEATRAACGYSYLQGNVCS